MINYISKLIVLVLTSTILFVTYADIAFSGSSVNSLSISSERTESDKAYYLKIHIDGIESSQLKVKMIETELQITAQNGGMISGNAIAGGQFVNYSYRFPNDADLQHLKRVNSDKLVVFTIPKINQKSDY
ncbi:Hsp20/alpha crystallin family protein [uncultured Cocleimonas sp.]|uniref:Hsp20/alpha crystallin family protein n=1 Tax=uncultured Cocleimonas sp. TaxID=1051587 RepID=UPI002603E013|nr:Hsp20/alpha crystallin family protein [uncultured Cocleimonas sp.]